MILQLLVILLKAHTTYCGGGCFHLEVAWSFDLGYWVYLNAAGSSTVTQMSLEDVLKKLFPLLRRFERQEFIRCVPSQNTNVYVYIGVCLYVFAASCHQAKQEHKSCWRQDILLCVPACLNSLAYLCE